MSAGDALHIAATATAAATTVGAAAFGVGAAGKAKNTAMDRLEKGTSGLPNLGKEIGQKLSSLDLIGGGGAGMDKANVPDPLGPPPPGSVAKSSVPDLPYRAQGDSSQSSVSNTSSATASDCEASVGDGKAQWEKAKSQSEQGGDR